ncbi:MAG: hypothetical protein P8J86_01785 [Phycisphaerales bacterium]|nr:hypothetical protein [Phycisphaerales bacterium]
MAVDCMTRARRPYDSDQSPYADGMSIEVSKATLAIGIPAAAMIIDADYGHHWPDRRHRVSGLPGPTLL